MIIEPEQDKCGRINLTIPSDVREGINRINRICGSRVNWSAVAAKAFRDFIDNFGKNHVIVQEVMERTSDILPACPGLREHIESYLDGRE